MGTRGVQQFKSFQAEVRRGSFEKHTKLLRHEDSLAMVEAPDPVVYLEKCY
jgi:hypothetical protein